jgi:hypothetical protein
MTAPDDLLALATQHLAAAVGPELRVVQEKLGL